MSFLYTRRLRQRWLRSGRPLATEPVWASGVQSSAVTSLLRRTSGIRPLLGGILAIWIAVVVTDVLFLNSAVRRAVTFNPKAAIGSSSWDNFLYSQLSPSCAKGRVVAQPYNGTIPATALASFPRSGSSYTRSLMERASAFAAECLGLDSPFLVKTHYPLSKDIDASIPHWQHYHRAVRVIRNPLDAAWSNYHFDHVKSYVLQFWLDSGTCVQIWRLRDSTFYPASHEGRVKGMQSFTSKHKPKLEQYAERWNAHARYWRLEAKIPVLLVRYEDLRINTFSALMSMLSFLLPVNQLPPLEQVACAIENDPRKDPYRSRKSPVFSAWDSFEPEIRQWYLSLVKDEWCLHGYDALFSEVKGFAAPIDCSTKALVKR